VVSLATHLRKASPEVQAIYRAVVAELKQCGPLDAVPTKTGINLLSRTSLGGIRLQKSKARLGLVLTRRIQDPRIQSVLRISPRSYVHYINVESMAGLDATLRGWLREAHQVGMLAGQRVG
jgi:hypothetical protein